MGVKSYIGKKGETLWAASAYARSRANPGIKVEKERTGFGSQREAQGVCKQLERECEREVLVKEAHGSTWGAVVEEFSDYMLSPRSGLHTTTREDYVASARKHTGSWWRRQAAEITKADVRELFNQLSATEGYSVGHLKKIKVIINLIFVYGIENRLIRGIDQSPTVGFSFAREEEKEPEVLTLGEIKRLLISGRQLDHPWYYHWALALLTGMRNGELYALQWTDVEWENNSLTVSKSFSRRKAVKTGDGMTHSNPTSNRPEGVKCTKGGYWRTVPISSELKSLLLELRAKTGSTQHVLPRMWQWDRGHQARELRKFCLGLGLPSVRFHALRACFATQLIRNGVPPIQIQKICGWRDLKTMQRYIRMAGIEIEGATEALKILPEPEIAAKVVSMFTGNAVQ
jgi:integrase